jgi:hypothetical protein
MDTYFFFMDRESAGSCSWILEKNKLPPVEEAMAVARRHHCYYSTGLEGPTSQGTVYKVAGSIEIWSPDPTHRSRRNHIITYNLNSKYVVVD